MHWVHSADIQIKITNAAIECFNSYFGRIKILVSRVPVVRCRGMALSFIPLMCFLQLTSLVGYNKEGYPAGQWAERNFAKSTMLNFSLFWEQCIKRAQGAVLPARKSPGCSTLHWGPSALKTFRRVMELERNVLQTSFFSLPGNSHQI